MEKYFSDITTIIERDLIIKELENLETTLYENNEITSDRFYSNLSPTLSQIFLNWTRDNRSSRYNRDEILRIIRDFLHDLSKCSIVELRCAYQLSQQEIRDIQLRIIQYTQTFCIVDFIIDPSLIGGAIFAFKGKFKDYSIANFIDTSYGSI